jgi:two-component system, chemotaxis family, chemotaxis protein CheY
MKAIVVDDSRAMRSILKGILRGAGFEVVEAGDGVEGLERLAAAGAVDLALVDWNMPRMDGPTFVKAVRANPEHQSMRVMMVTSENDMTRVADALEFGANEFVMKPFTKEILLEKLQLLGVSPG